MSDLTFQQINNILGNSAFSYDGTNILLNVSAITGDTYTSLSDEGIIEFAFKFLKACHDTQTSVNSTSTTPLTSFSTPFYGTVQNNNPPTIEGSITVTGVIPLDVDSVVGR